MKEIYSSTNSFYNNVKSSSQFLSKTSFVRKRKSRSEFFPSPSLVNNQAFSIPQNQQFMQTSTNNQSVKNFFSFLLLSVTMILSFLSVNVNAQNYSFSNNTSGSLALLRDGATAVDMSTGTTSLIAANKDATASAVTSIGFTYAFKGGSYTSFSVNDDGVVQLGSTAVATNTYTITGGTSESPRISAFNADLRTGTTSGKVHYKLIGTAPNRCLVVEFTNMMLFYKSTGTTGTSTWQVRLYENGAGLEFVYGAMNVGDISAADRTPSIGYYLGASENSFGLVKYSDNTCSFSDTTAPNSAIASTGNIANLNSAANGSRTVYSFMYPCVTPTTQPTSLLLTSTANTYNTISGSFTGNSSLSYLVVRTATNTAPSPVAGTSYSVGSTDLGAGTYVESYGPSTSFTSTNLSSNTQYYYWVFASSGAFCVGSVNTYNTTDPLAGSQTTNTRSVPCPTITPVDGSSTFKITDTLKWSAVTSIPPTTSYDVYFSSNRALVEAKSSSVKICSTNVVLYSAFATSPLSYSTTYYWQIVVKAGAADSTTCGIKSFTTAAPAVPNCYTGAVAPVAGSTGTMPTSITWGAATGLPAVTGYDVYVSTNQLAIQGLSLSAKVVSNTPSTSMTFGISNIVLAPNNTYYWTIVPQNYVGAASNCNIYSFTTTSSGAKTSTAKGGLWSDVNTWVGGVVPAAYDSVTIADGATVTVNASLPILANLTIGKGVTGSSVFQWAGTSYGLTVIGNISIASNGKLLAYSSAGTGQTINIGGNFTNNGYANLAVASTILNFNGSQQGASNSQVLGGSGTFEGDTTTRGIIRDLRFQTSGSSTISTTQKLIAYTLYHTAGSLNTNGKLIVDNSPQVYGQNLNRQVANLVVTNINTGYNTTTTPVVGPGTSTNDSLWRANQAFALGQMRINGSNVYLVIRAGTSGSTAPTLGQGLSTVSDTVRDGTATLLWVGNTGTLGYPVYTTGSALTPAAGSQYFYGDKLLTHIKGVNTLSFLQLDTLIKRIKAMTTIGDKAGINSDTLQWVGSPATATVNLDANGSVRSFNLVSAGSGYLTTAPVFAVVNMNYTAPTTAATGAAVFFQQIIGPANSAVYKTPQATFTGGLDIVSQQKVLSTSTSNGGYGYNGTPKVGFSLPTNYDNLMVPGRNGAGFKAGFTTVVTGAVTTTGAQGMIIKGPGGTGAGNYVIYGGSRIGNLSGPANASIPLFNVVVAQGKVVSVICTGGGSGWLTQPDSIKFYNFITSTGTKDSAVAKFPTNALAQATAVMAGGTITNIKMTNTGSGYSVAPTVSLDSTGQTSASFIAATAPVSRVGLYNLLYQVLTPTTAIVESNTGAEIPSNRRINALTVNTLAKVKLAGGDLELYAGTSALTLSTATNSGTTFDLNTSRLFFSNPLFTGATSTLGGMVQSAFGYVKNGSIRMTLPGTAAATTARTFPFEAPLSIVTGNAGDSSFGATINYITVTPTGKPQASNPLSITPIGSRSYYVQTDSIPGSAVSRSYGVNPTIGLTYTPADTILLSLQQQFLFVGQSDSLVGTWKKRSLSSGGTASLIIPGAAATCSRTTATSGNGPFVSVGGKDYFAFVDSMAAPVISGTYGPYCSAGGQTVTINSSNGTFKYVTSVKFNGLDAYSFTVVDSTRITAVTPSGITAGNIAVTAYGVSGYSSGYSISTTPVFNNNVMNPSNGYICAAGDKVTITLNDIGADSYSWSPSTGLNTSSGLTVEATPTTSTSYVVSALLSGSGCTVTRTFNVGVIPGAVISPTASPAVSCFNQGQTITLNSNLSAGNFSVTPITYAPAKVPSNATALVNRGVTNTNVPSSCAYCPLDDAGFPNIPIGFSYNFFGNFFTEVAAGTNGLLMFGSVPSYAGGAGINQYTFINTPVTFPNASNPGNVIGAGIADCGAAATSQSITTTLISGSKFATTATSYIFNLGDSLSGTGIAVGTLIDSIISTSSTSTTFRMTNAATASGANSLTYYSKPYMRYWTEGTAPTRRFVFEFKSIAGTSGSNANGGSVQVILYETTGLIEMHIEKAESGRTRTYGLQDATQTIGAVIPGRQAFSTGILTPEAWRFSPPTNYGFKWNPIANLSDTNTSATVYSVPSAGSKSVTLKVSNPTTGCVSNKTINFVVNSTPVTPTVNGVTEVCGSGFTALMTNTPAAGNTIKWYNTPSLGVDPISSGALYTTPVITTTTTYYASEENPTTGCKSPRLAKTVTVNTPPTLTVNKPVVCAGTSFVKLTASTSNVTNYDTYIWSTTSVATANQTAGLFEDSSLTIPYFGRSLSTVYAGNLTPGTKKYYCNASSFQTLCSAKDSAVITVLPSTAFISSDPAFICIQQSATLTLNATPAVVNLVKWQQSTDSINYTDVANVTGTTYTTQTLNSNNYYKATILNDKSAACYTAVYKLSAINPIAQSASGNTICAASGATSFTFTATGAAGSGFKWYSASSSGTLLASSATYSPTASSSSATYYVAAVQDGCEGTTRLAATSYRNNPPAMSINATNQSVCKDAIVRLSVTSDSTNFSSYVWSPVSGLFLDANATIPYTGSSSRVVYAKKSTTGNNIFTVRGSNSDGCWMESIDTVFVMPVSVSASTPSSVCLKGPVTINLTPSTGYGSGAIQWWSSTDSANYTQMSQQTTTTLNTGTDSIVNTTYYRAIIKDQLGNTCATANSKAFVNAPQILTITPSTICGYGSTTIYVTATSGTVNWYDSATGGTVKGTGNAIVVSLQSPVTQKTYYASVTNSSCPSPRVAVSAQVSYAPTISVSADNSVLCSNAFTKLSAYSNPMTNYNSYTWSPVTDLYFDSTGLSPYTSGSNATKVYLISGTAGSKTYTLNAYSSKTLCTATSQSVSVNVLPSSFTVSSSPASICKSDSALISVPSSTPGNIVWKMSLNGTTYDSVGTGLSYQTPIMTSVSYYQAIMRDPAGNTCTTTNTPYVLNVSNPQVTSVTGATRCGTGSVTLSASATSGTYKWYTVATGGTSIKTGQSPTITVNRDTTFYVGLTVSGCEGTRTPVSVNVSTASPLILSSNSQTVSCENPIVAISVTSDLSSYDTYVWSPSTGLYTDADATVPYVANSSATTVYAKSVVAGTKVFTVTANNAGTLCSNVATSSVTVTSLSPVAVSPVYAKLCADEVKAISVTSDTTSYSSYSWTPASGLYTDETASTPYVAGTSATTVYAKASASGIATYTVNASTTTSACVGAASAKIYVLPNTGNITSNTASICKTGSATLTLNTSDTLPSGSIQWQISLNGTNYSNILNANSLTYNTGTITTSTYYRAVVSSPSGICFTTNSFMQLVNNPSVDSVKGGSRCGSGQVILSAIPSAGGSISWYAAASGGSSLASGTTYTPTISANVNYYAEASIGSCKSTSRVLVAAAVSSATPVTVNRAKVVCNNVYEALNVTSSLSDYESYAWTPSTNLYSDLDGTPLGNSSATTVYIKSATAGQVVYTVSANNTSNGCNASAKDTVIVQASSATVYSNSTTAFCLSGSAKLSLNSTSRPIPGTVQWTLNGTNILGATDSGYTTPTLTASSNYQAIIKNTAGDVCFTTAVFTQSVTSPQVLDTISNTRCAAGKVILGATPSQGATIKWYAASTLGSSLASGNTYTADVTSTTTYYVSASIGTCENNSRKAVVANITPAPAVTLTMGGVKTKTICNEVITEITGTPSVNYDKYVWLPSAGLFTDITGTTPYDAATDSTITTVYVKRSMAGLIKYVLNASNSTSGCYAFDTATLNIQPASATISGTPICISGTSTMSLTPSTGYAANTIQWKSSADTITANFSNINLATNSSYTSAADTVDKYYQVVVTNGSTNCFTSNKFRLQYLNPKISIAASNVPRCGSGSVTLTATASNGGTVKWYNAPTNGDSITPVNNGAIVTPSAASTTVFYAASEIGACSSARLADTLTVTTPPSISVTPEQTVCNGSIVAYNITTDPVYNNYVWTREDTTTHVVLYTDAAATIPYTAGSSATVLYGKSTRAGSVYYKITASNNDCYSTAYTALSTQLQSATISSSQNNLCISGSATLNLNPASPYGLGSIEWQRSIDSINWVSCPGAVGTTFTTPLQADTRFYKALIKDGTNSTCFSTPVMKLGISNPQITNVNYGSVCGKQPATISVSVTAGSTVNWYATSTSTTVLGTGNSFTTPEIAATTTFYAQAAGGGCFSARVPVLAIYNAPPAFNTTSTRICVGNIKELNASADLVNYNTFSWSPADSLYTDSAATIPYVAGTNATVVYYKSSVLGSNQYTLSASNATTGCVNSTIIKVDNINITFSNITANPNPVCAGYPVNLSVYSPVVSSGPQTLPTGYCAGGGGTNNADEQIFAVSFGSMNNIQSESCLSNYSNYTSSITAPTVNAGQSVPFSVTVDECNGATYYSSGVSVFIDYNRDGDFDDAGEIVYTTSSTTTNPHTKSGSITIPTTVTAGLTTMRVVAIESTISPTPCGTYTYGETEDYAVNIIGYVPQNPNLTYTWNPSNLNGANVVDTPRTVGTVTYIVTAADLVAGCSAQDTIDITVNPTPAAPSVMNSVQCGAGIPTAAVSAPSNQIKWYNAASGGTRVQNGGTTYTSSINTTTTFYVTVTSTDYNCESPRAMVIAEVVQPDSIIASASNTSICLNGTISLSSTQIGTRNDYSSYKWSASPSAGSGITNTLNGVSQTITPTIPGTYTYTVNALDSTSSLVTSISTPNNTKSCKVKSTIVVTVNSLPVIDSINATSNAVCYGKSVTLTAYPISATNTYVWTPGNLSGSSVSVTPLVATTYSVTATNSFGCASPYAVNKTIAVNALPAAPSGDSSVQCGSGNPPATVNSNIVAANHTYNWYTSPTGGTPVYTETTNRSFSRLLQSIAATQTMYVAEVNASGCESDRATVYMRVIPSTAIYAAASTQSACIGSAIQLYAIDPTGGVNPIQFTWTASPAQGSGIPTSRTLQSDETITLTPTGYGNFNYILSGLVENTGCTVTTNVSVTVNNSPAITSVLATPSSVCLGDSVSISATTSSVAAGDVAIGDGTVANTTTSYPTPFGQFYGSNHEQYLIRASELTAAGLVAGNITSIAWNLNAGYTYAALQNFQVNMAHTAQNSMTTTLINSGFTNVLTPATYTPSSSTGYSTISFENPFNWDGVSNVVVDVSFSNCSVCNGTSSCTTSFTSNGAVLQKATSYVSTVNYHADGNCTINSFTPSNTGTTYSQRPNMMFRGQKVTSGAGSLIWSWNPGGLNAQSIRVKPANLGANKYFVSATDPATGCTGRDSLVVVANLVPTAPFAYNSAQCGFGVPTAFVVGTNNANGSFKWYNAASGGTLVQNGGYSYNAVINSTTTFYVAQATATCEGPRTMVVCSVTQPDSIRATANTSICLNGTVNLGVTLNGTTNNYNYSWTAAPASGSGMSNTLTGGNQSVTPTAAGTYVYTVVGRDSGCATKSSITVTVNPNPSVDSIRASNAAICDGNSTTLSVYSMGLAAGPQTMPTGYLPSSATSAADEEILRVKFGTLDNTSDCSTTGGAGSTLNMYSDYSSLSAPTVTVGDSVDVSVRVGYCGSLTAYSNSMNMYIDWNRDGDFADQGENAIGKAYGAAALTGTTYSGKIRIPDYAVAGVTKLRVVLVESSTIAPTGTYSWGETEDYAVNIIGQFKQSAGYTYNWTPGNLSGANVTVTPHENTTYSVVINNPVTGCSSTASQSIVVNPVPSALTGASSTQCGIGLPSAYATSNNNAATHIYNWYSDSTGGTLVQTDTTDRGYATYNQFVAASDTLWVAEANAFGCESNRAAVSFIVTIPDSLSPTVTYSSNCLGSAITLYANAQAGGQNNYQFTWSASPLQGSGFTAPVTLQDGDSITVTPTVSGTYNYIVTAYDELAGCRNIRNISVNIDGGPQITSVTADHDSICAGNNVTITATTQTVAPGNATIGNGTVVNTTTSYPSPFGQFYGSNHEQYLIRASELTATGLVAGNITSIAWNLNAGYTYAPLQNFQINMAHTAQNSMTTTLVNSGFTNVVPSATYTPSASTGFSTISFANPFNWDGVSNVVIDVSFSNCSVCNGTASCTTSFTSNGAVLQKATSYVSTVNYHADGNCTINSFTPSNTGTTYSQRPNMRFRGQKVSAGAGSLGWTWNPGAVDSAVITATPSSTTTYAVTATDPATGCTSAPVNKTITVVAIPEVTSVTPSTQCGFGIPSVAVSGNASTYNWYSAQTGGTLLQSGGNNYTKSIKNTTTLWVEPVNNGMCYGTRTPVVATVIPADSIKAISSSAELCLGASLDLNVANVANTPVANYNYTWSVSPAIGSGLSNGQQFNTATITPTVAGSYVFTVVGYDSSAERGVCMTLDNITVKVNALPVIDSANVTANTICVGSTVTLNAYSGALTTGTQTLPSGYASSSATSAADEEILRVKFGTLDNSSDCSTTGGAGSTLNMYSNYSNLAAPTVTAGDSVDVAVKVGYCASTTAWSNSMNMYIDWNRDGDFADQGENAIGKAYGAAALTGTTYTGKIRVPDYAAAGLTKLRVVLVESSTINPTGTYTWGETEDYAINVIAGTNQDPVLTYNWTPGNLTGSSVSVSPNSSTTYTVSAVNAAGCSSNSKSVTVNVVPVQVSASADVTTICAGEAVSLSSTASGVGSLSYTWTDGSTLVSRNTGVTVHPTVTTTYRITVTDACGNPVKDSVTITVNPIPVVSINQTGTINLCSGSIQTLTSSVPNISDPSYQWTLNGVALSDGTNSSYDATLAGTYGLIVSGSVSGCSSSAQTMSINILQSPSSISITPANPEPLLGAGASVTLTATAAVQSNEGSIGGSDSLKIQGGGNPYRNNMGTSNNNPNNESITQLLIKASELTSLGLTSGSSINKLGFKVDTAGSKLLYFTIKMAHTSVSRLDSILSPTMSTVFYRDSLTPVVGTNNHTFSTPFVWNGSSNVLVEITQRATQRSQVTVAGSTTSFIGTRYAASRLIGAGTDRRPVMYISANKSLPITWSPSVGLNTTNGTIVVASPTQTTTYVATATNALGCSKSDSVTVIVPASLNVKAYLEGFYRGQGTMVAGLHDIEPPISADETATDTITISLWNPNNLTSDTADYSAKCVLHTDGNAFVSIPDDLVGYSYFIVIKHRNSIETWSADAVTISSVNSYDFTTGTDKAYGDGTNAPMKHMGNGVYAIYGGDVNNDGTADATDLQITENDAYNFFFGYNPSDCTGDGASDASDMQLIENNANLFLFMARPY